MLAGLRGGAAQRGDLTARCVDEFDHLDRRGTERVGNQGDLRVPQRDLDLRGGRRLGPTEQLQGVGVGVAGGHTVVGEDLLGEVEVLLRNHVLQHLGEHLWRDVGVHALVLVGDHDVDAVGTVADALVDPVQFDFQLLGGEPDGAEHPETAGFADRDDHVATVGEREDGELDAQFVAEGSVHDRLLGRRTETCSSFTTCGWSRGNPQRSTVEE